MRSHTTMYCSGVLYFFLIFFFVFFFVKSFFTFFFLLLSFVLLSYFNHLQVKTDGSKMIIIEYDMVKNDQDSTLGYQKKSTNRVNLSIL